MLTTTTIDPAGSPRASIIWLHGLGADGRNLADIMPWLNLPAELKVRAVFPDAPFREITCFGGGMARAWFDLVDLKPEAENEADIREAAQLINELIAQELSLGIPSSRIILAGFSQGGAMALHTGLRYPQPLGGIVALSTWLPLQKQWLLEREAANATTPIFIAHGDNDRVIPLSWAEESCKTLESAGHSVCWSVYSMEHTICPEEVRDLKRALLEYLKP